MHAKTQIDFTNYSPFIRWSDRYKNWVGIIEFLILIAWWVHPVVWLGVIFAVTIGYDVVWSVCLLVETWRHHRRGDLHYK